MLSEVERGAKVPSVLVLDRIATALDTSIARLLDEERSAPVILMRRSEQHIAKETPGWERRILSPVLPGIEFEFMRTTIGPRGDAGACSPHAPGSREYLAMESGTLLLTIDSVEYKLSAGDSIYYAGDCVHAFKNPWNKPCIYYLTMDVSSNRDAFGLGRRAHSSKEKRTHGRH
jgi:quercetin dioxygenase-like cupin family protein